MSVLIDTPVWSLALRRKTAQLSVAERQLVEEWKALIFDGRARLTIRQEVLSGVREARDFERLRERLAAFDDVPAAAADHECAASYFNACRAKGITPTAFDVLICALAARHGLTIFTTDADFTRYAKILPVKLHALKRPDHPSAR
jgi:predicted nucleic acid-binding protein